MRSRAVATGIAVGLVTAVAILSLSQGRAEARLAIVLPVLSPEVARVARTGAKDGDAARRAMSAIYRRNGLTSALDYTAAARLFSESKLPAELQLAHDLAIAGLTLGDRSAGRVVAQTEDRWLRAIGRDERFGTIDGRSSALTDLHRRLVVGG